MALDEIKTGRHQEKIVLLHFWSFSQSLINTAHTERKGISWIRDVHTMYVPSLWFLGRICLSQGNILNFRLWTCVVFASWSSHAMRNLSTYDIEVTKKYWLIIIAKRFGMGKRCRSTTTKWMCQWQAAYAYRRVPVPGHLTRTFKIFSQIYT